MRYQIKIISKITRVQHCCLENKYNIKQETRYTIEYFFRKIPNIKHQNQNKHKILAIFYCNSTN